jgi:hypothetical protein
LDNNQKFMKRIITSGVITVLAMLGMVSPAFAATTYTYPSTHASSTKIMHATTTPSTTSPKTTPKTKAVLLIGSVGQNTTGLLTVIVKTKTYNVTVGSTALIYSKTGKIIVQSDIKAGDKIRVRGLATGTQVMATSMRDLSL